MDNKTNKLSCLTVKNETPQSAEVYIHGDIVDDDMKAWLSECDGKTFAGYVLPVDVREKLESLQGKDLTIYINSDGGSVPAGMAIANMIKRHDGHTVGVVDGWAASIASVIFMACDELYMPKNTFLMIHKPSAVAVGDSDDMLRVATMLDTVQEGIEQVYLERAKEGVTAEEIRKAVEAETWYTAAEASEVFDITVKDTSVQLVACSKGLSFKTMPEAVKNAKTATDKEQSPEKENLQDDIKNRKRKLAIELELLT